MSGFETTLVAGGCLVLAIAITVTAALTADHPLSVMEVFGWVMAATGFATLVTWAVTRERKDRRLTREYRAGMRTDLIAELGIQDEVQS